MSAWWLVASARAWTTSEFHALDLGAIEALEVTQVGEERLLLAGSAAGLAAIAPSTGEVRARIDGIVSDLWVGDIDGDGISEVIVCGPSGIDIATLPTDPQGLLSIVRRELTSSPCEAVDSVMTSGGPALVTVEQGQLSVLSASMTGPKRISYESLAIRQPPALATSGFTVAVIDSALALQRLIGADARAISAAPVLAVVGWPSTDEPQFGVLRGGEHPELILSEGSVAIEGGATGLVAGPSNSWLLDEAASRIGLLDEGAIRWFPSPVSPKIALAAELSGDDCIDLVLSDGNAKSSLAMGDCSPAPAASTALSAPSPAAPAVPPPPQELLLEDAWPLLHAQVGVPLVTRVRDVKTRWSRYKSRGGPPGMAVNADGSIEFTPDPDDVGRWRVSVRSTSDGIAVHWTGFELAIWPPGETPPATEPLQDTDGTGDVEEEEIQDEIEESSVQPPPAEPRIQMTSLAPRRCLLGMGIAGGAASAGGSTWENLGAANLRGGVSPLASIACGIGAPKAQLVVGLDSAPYFRYGDVPRDRRHLLALSGGVDFLFGATSLGPLASIGATSRGVGLHALWLGINDWKRDPMGVELRALWLAPKAGIEASAAWIWTL